MYTELTTLLIFRDVKQRKRDLEGRPLRKITCLVRSLLPLCGSLGFCFFALDFENKKTIK